ncbi:hypothetical protein [Flavobacterium sp.]|uniref:hypothetical protein n=1 Tax=Flavobacterium sp. TaxID=239 RepID=UPI0025B84CBA|nr:hypothetical protein [Flavobacterium sp.]MBA4154159.1 hypothetical protein [Flavobacterium sp.]
MSILRQRTIAPKLSYELGLLIKSINLGQSVIIWNAQIYNSEYDVELVSEIPYTSDDNMKFVLTPIAVGEYKIQLTATNKFRTFFSYSNTITLIVE